MDMVQTVKTRDSDVLHGHPVELLDKDIIILRSLSLTIRSVKNRSYLMDADHGISHLGQIQAIRDGCHSDLGHLTDLLFEGHALQCIFHLPFKFPVNGDGRFHDRLAARGHRNSRQG